MTDPIDNTQLPGVVESNLSETNIVSTVTSKLNIKTLVDNINIVSKIHIDRYLTFVNDPNIKKIVTVLTNDPESVQDVVNMLDLVLADGKIDFNDGMLLLGLSKKIVSLRTSALVSIDLTLNHFLTIIKLVLTILAKEGVLKIVKTDEFIEDITQVLNLIENSEKIVESIPCCLPLRSLIFGKK
jgi:hypothetical protein